MVSSHATPGQLTAPWPTTVTFRCLRWIEKLAPTSAVGALALTEQVAPEQSVPEKPSKFQPTAGVGMSLIRMPRAKSKLAVVQVGPQLMPAGVDAMVPRPLLFSVSLVTSLKLGDTVTLVAGILNEQVAFVEPLQTAPVPQLIPGPLTVPAPVPALTTVTTVRARKFGVTETLDFSAKAQVALTEPVQAPPVQLTKTKPALGVACSVTAVP